MPLTSSFSTLLEDLSSPNTDETDVDRVVLDILGGFHCAGIGDNCCRAALIRVFRVPSA